MLTIYVGNLSFNSTEDEVRDLFEQHGAVHSVKLVSDRETGRPRGFGFVHLSCASPGESPVPSEQSAVLRPRPVVSG